jgi:hypothetical protein
VDIKYISGASPFTNAFARTPRPLMPLSSPFYVADAQGSADARADPY